MTTLQSDTIWPTETASSLSTLTRSTLSGMPSAVRTDANLSRDRPAIAHFKLVLAYSPCRYSATRRPVYPEAPNTTMSYFVFVSAILYNTPSNNNEIGRQGYPVSTVRGRLAGTFLTGRRSHESGTDQSIAQARPCIPVMMTTWLLKLIRKMS